jgi:light-regulated signal transduction histidine kinase (bacteriophytochrome)
MAIAVMAAFLLAAKILFTVVSYNPVIFVIVAIVVVSWMFGTGPGVLCSVLAAFAAKPLFYPKIALRFEAGDVLRLALFLLLTGFVSGLVGARRKAEEALRASNSELDNRVRARTAELTAANRELQLTNAELIEARIRAEASNAALRRANADLEQFAYSASHDLQEPIRNVSIYSQLISTKCAAALDDEGREYLAYVKEGADRMGLLVRDLLAYTRTVGQSPEPIETIDANAVLDFALANLDAAIKESGACVIRGTLPRVEMHKVHLQQLLQNLIGNAIKFRGDIQPRIEVKGEPTGEFWQFSVKDNGIGVEDEYKEKIFGIFTRLHSHTDYPGTGMGLAICQRIVDRYGGRLWVESNDGDGSTFYFTVRRADPASRA